MSERTSKASTKSTLKSIPTKRTAKGVTKSPKKNMSGSIVSFIVVGVILLMSLGGTVYYLSNRNDDNATQANETTQAPATTESQDDDQSAPVATENDTEDEAAPEAAAPASPSPETPVDTVPTEVVQAGPSGSAPGEMPRTGAGDSLVGLLGAAVFSFAAIAYIRSLRPSLITQE